MFRTLQSPWFIALTGGLLYLGTTIVLLKPAQFAGVHAAAEEIVRSAEDDPSWKFRNPELDQWVTEIKKEKETLATREQQLNDLQTRLNAQVQELTTLTQTVMQLQADFDRNVLRYKAADVDNIKRQVKILTAMPLDESTGMLSRMQDEDVLRILALMKPDDASLYLDALGKIGKDGPRRAASLLERMRNIIPPTAGRGNNPP